MTTEKKQRKDKEIVLELESQIKDVKHQLTEQLKCLDGRLDNHYSMTAELMDFYQKRAEVEIEYSKGLDKIVRQILTKHKAERQKRENWQNYSTYKLWQTLLEVTSKQSRCHSTFSESLTNIVTSKFVQMRDDMTYIYKKCYEIAGSLHGELNKSMTELHSFLKTYQQYHGESELLQSKLFKTETRKTKVEQDQKKGTLSKKLINFDKKAEKHRSKVQEGNLKALKARNEYLLSIDSTNAALRKYFIDDLPDLINAMDYSYHISLSQITVNSVDLEAMLYKLNNENLMTVANKSKGLNQISDRQVFLQLHHQVFSLPKRFDFLSHKGDAASEVQSPTQLRNEMVSRLQTIMERLHAIKLENDELWKTLETTDNSMVARLTAPEIDAAAIFQTGKPTLKGDSDKQAKEKIETQNFYFNKFKNYELNSNLVARLQAKCVTLEKVLALSKTGVHRSVVTSKCQPKRPAIGNFTLETRPKLFGGSIREYVKATGQEIPLVIRSCTKVINLYGMHHQGVFRIPGLQHEINEYKNMFERGEEPILVKVETRDINSVAGVLKLYFRELSEPLFPLQLFDELVACSKYNVEDSEELKKCIERLQELLLSLPRPILIVIRYLFAFLNHLSEYSDENMMDAHNLSVCFGPTLMPVPPDHDPVNHQNQINELVRILIVYQERIFPSDGGVVYEKFIIDEENDLEESVDNLLEGAGGDNSEDDSESYLEAVALHDFQGRSGQELTLKKGETLKLYKRVSSDWWEGATGEQSGLVPHKFIAVNNRRRIAGSVDGEDKLFVSTESLPSRSASVTVAIRSTPVENDNSAFDRSVSQPNICDSPPKNRRKKGDGKQIKDSKNDSALSSNSTITFSESSFSNLSDEQRPSLEGSIGSHRKDSATDGREPRKSLSKEVIAICKGCEGKKSSSQERKGESFSPLIPVLEIVEPYEIILEARDLPAGFSAVVTPVESVEVVTVVATTDKVVEASRGASSPPVTSNKTTDSKDESSLMLGSKVVECTVIDQSVEFGNSLSPASLMSSPLKGSPEKSPNKLTSSLTDSYFSFSLIPLESKPPLPGSKPGTPRSSISSPDNLDINKLMSDEQKVIALAESCPVTVDTNITTTTTTTTTTITTTTKTVPCFQIYEEGIATSSQNIMTDQTPGFPLSENLPPPPDDLLADFPQESPETLRNGQQILSVGNMDLSSPLSHEKTTSNKVTVLDAEVDGSSPAELPTLSTPSFLRYMQNMQKQGGLLPPSQLSNNSINPAVPAQLQLNKQFLAISDSIATASLGEEPPAAPGKFYTPPCSARQSQDLTGTKSLDAFINQAESTAATKFSSLKKVSTSQVPSTSSSTDSGSSALAKIRSQTQGVSVQPSPRLAAMSFNLPTLSIYTTLAPTVTSPPIAVSSTSTVPLQSSTSQVLSSVPPLALSPTMAHSSSQKPLTSTASPSPLLGLARLPVFSNFPPAFQPSKPWDSSNIQSISSQQQAISSPGVSPVPQVPGEKSSKTKPPTMKKPAAKN